MGFYRETYITPKWLESWSEKEKGPNGRCLCKLCRKEVQKPRRYWCSQKCINELNRQSGSPRKLAFNRDKGFCALCGRDCQKLESVFIYCSYERKSKKWLEELKKKYPWAWHQTGFGYSSGHTWEADHTEPVAEGGGDKGMDNIRTLCVPCHRLETRKLHKRLADRRAGRQNLPGM